MFNLHTSPVLPATRFLAATQKPSPPLPLAGDDAILPHVASFLAEQGRARYLRKLYRALQRSRSGAARQAALSIFEAQRGGYHPIAVRMVAADLGLGPEAEHGMP